MPTKWTAVHALGWSASVLLAMTADAGPRERDGIPPDIDRSEFAELRFFLFCGSMGAWVPGWQSDHGEPYEDSRGYGWSRDLRKEQLAPGTTPFRNADDAVASTFVTLQDTATWRCNLENGSYRVVLCMGHPRQRLELPVIQLQGNAISSPTSVEPGAFIEITEVITIARGSLELQIGGPSALGTPICINWMVVEKLW